LFIFAFAHHHTAHSSVLTIALFHFVPHNMIFSKCWKGNNWMSFLIYS
jgi:hypothetical protein